MGVILAKFRREKSTEAVLETLQEKINALETFTVNTQQQKKRIVGNFLAASIGIYVIAFLVFYFVYFPPTWKVRIVYCIPLLLFPIIIILLRYLFSWYFERKLNKNSKKLSALRAEKKKILEQVMDKETYKVAVNLLARYADKPSSKSLFALTPTPSNKPLHNRSLPAPTSTQRTEQLTLTASPQLKTLSSALPTTPRQQLTSQLGTSSPSTALMLRNSGFNQQVRRRTPFPIVNQQEKGVFDRIVDVLIGDGPQDRFAMICKECFSHNGMALKDDFEYTTFRCAFCNALNPSRKTRPMAPRLSVMPASPASDTSESEDDKDDSDEGTNMNLNANIKPFSTPLKAGNISTNTENDNTPAITLSSDTEEEEERDQETKVESQNVEVKRENEEVLQAKTNSSFNDLLKQLEEKSDSAIEDPTLSPE